MSWPVRVGLGLSVILVLVILSVEPATRYYWLLSGQTLPELGKPKTVQSLSEGLTNKQWTERFVPGDLKPQGPEASSAFINGRLALGWKWFHLIGLFCSAIFVFVLSVLAFGLAFAVARRIPSPLLSLGVALVLMAALYAMDGAARFDLPQNPAGLAELPVQAGKLMAQVWAAPIAMLSAAFLASFLPFRGVESKPGQLARFAALLRDLSFFGVAMILLLFILHSVSIHFSELAGSLMD